MNGAPVIKGSSVEDEPGMGSGSPRANDPASIRCAVFGGVMRRHNAVPVRTRRKMRSVNIMRQSYTNTILM